MFLDINDNDYDFKLSEQCGIDLQSGEILTEFAQIISVNYNICFGINPDSNRNIKGLEYFKIYNNANISVATKEIRILFREPKYIIHRNPKNKKQWYMNSKEIKDMIKYLNMSSNKFGKTIYDSNITVWQALILDYNYVASNGYIGYEDTLEKKNKDFLPIDLPIPDYTQLK